MIPDIGYNNAVLALVTTVRLPCAIIGGTQKNAVEVNTIKVPYSSSIITDFHTRAYRKQSCI